MHNVFITELFDWRQPEPSKNVKFINRLLEKLGFWCRLSPPDQTGSMTNVEQRINMYHLASQVLVHGVPGDFVELGCNAGHSAVLFQKAIDCFDKTRTLHVYDSFEGLPAKHAKDGSTTFFEGQMTTKQQNVIENFKSVGLDPPVIHPGWFDETLASELPQQIAFAHLDGDFYDSIKVSLEHVYPRLTKNAVCLIDDYSDPSIYRGFDDLPGVKAACDEFLADKPEEVSVLYAGKYAHGYFYKK